MNNMINNVVFTGDETKIFLYIAVAVVAIVGVIVILALTKPKADNKVEDDSEVDAENKNESKGEEIFEVIDEDKEK